jgi:putative ATP-dependent endonuclease of the OLD family
MELVSVTVRGFRNLDCEVEIPTPLAIIAGENNAGKSNLVDAIRIVLPPQAGPRFRRWITSDDFAHDGSGDPITDTFEIETVFGDLSEADRARMVTCLAPSLGRGFARLRLAANLTPAGRVEVAWYGGDSLQSDVEPWAREAATQSYLPPLRDAASDLRPGRENRLVALLSALAPEGTPARDEVENAALGANQSLRATTAVTQATNEVQLRVDAMVGRLFAQRTDLAFADPRFERVVSALRALVGDLTPLEMADNGLGFNNLLYMATLLAAIRHDTGHALHLVLVEEPEAHLHPQLQDLLMRYLEREGQLGTQVIVTSHSPNFAAAAGVERMTVLARTSERRVVARAPRSFNLPGDALSYLRRFLDVTKSSLLFARAVILVEGIAEQLLVPAMATQLGRPLHEAGVTVVNVGGVSFAPFVALFGDTRLPYRCAVVADGDPPSAPDEDELEGSEPMISATARKLKESETTTVRVFLSSRTLEWDLAIADNWDVLLDSLHLIKPRVSERLRTASGQLDGHERAQALLDAAHDVKGPFAQALVRQMAEGRELVVPPYLEEAINWVTESLVAVDA